MEIKVAESRNRATLIERIKNSRETLKASILEFSEEMIECYLKHDVVRMQNLIDAYKDHELKNRPRGTSFEHAEENALRNLDTASRIADGLLQGKSAIQTGFYARFTKDKKADVVTDFVRELTGYNPIIKRDYLKNK